LRNVELSSYFCSKEDHTLQYVVLSNEVGLSPFSLNLISLNFACSLKIKAVCIGIDHLILLMLLFSDPESVLTLLLFILESSGNHCQDDIKHPLQCFSVSLLGDTQILFHILQGVKASMYAKRGLKLLSR
jgi:hypothetical protein